MITPAHQETEGDRKRFSRISIRKATLVVILLTLLIVFPLFIIAEITESLHAELTGMYILYLIPFFLYIYAMKKKGDTVTGIFSFKKDQLKLVIHFIPLIILSIGVIWGLLLLLNAIQPEWAISYFDYLDRLEFLAITSETTLVQYILIFGVIVLLGPVVEEIIFRGIMLERLGAKYGYTTGLIISSVIFAILHVEYISTFLFGVILGLIYLKTGSLMVPSLIHIANNATALALMPLEHSFSSHGWDTIAPFLSYSAVGITLFFAGILWVVWFILKNRHVLKEVKPFDLPQPDKAAENRTAGISSTE